MSPGHAFLVKQYMAVSKAGQPHATLNPRLQLHAWAVEHVPHACENLHAHICIPYHVRCTWKEGRK